MQYWAAPSHVSPCTVSMHLRASAMFLYVMYALPVGPFLAAAVPYGPDLLVEICIQPSPRSDQYRTTESMFRQINSALSNKPATWCW